MGNNFDFESRKYVILLILICLMFAMLIIKAFDYLPEQDISNENMPKKENVIEESSSEVTNNEQSEQEEQKEQEESKAKEDKTKQNKDENHKSGVLYRSNDYAINSMFEEEIEIPKSPLDDDINDIPDELQNKLSPAEVALKSIINARKYTQAKDYKNAVNEYKNAMSATKDKDILAEVYDGIAQVYILNKNYRAALSFAVKAKELSPSISREFMVAKIYYELGQTREAIDKINRILRSK